ncbi:MAG: acetyl-CoA acetyltransferase [Candidatus Bathyarchaeia archaeon]
MPRRTRGDVAVVGVGYAGFKPTTMDQSYKELMFEAASRAYHDAELDPRRDVDAFVSASEDFSEGTSIFDEYVPDQIGAALRPVNTVAADGMLALIQGYMQVRTGLVDVVAVEAHSKASEVLTPTEVAAYALDPHYHRPVCTNPLMIAGLEMTRYMYETKTKPHIAASVVVKNRGNAFLNPLASYPARLTQRDVDASGFAFKPLRTLEVSQSADGAIVIVLASKQKAGKITDNPVWVTGVGWTSDTPWLESRNLGRALYAEHAAKQAYRQAGITKPSSEVDVAEVDDTYAYKELQHMEALNLCRRGEAGKLIENGTTAPEGRLPVNSSGGSLGVGHMLEATGLQKVLEVVLQLRGEAGQHQVEEAKVGVAQAWRGVPTASGSVVVFSTR